jgi:hypothetical protein
MRIAGTSGGAMVTYAESDSGTYLRRVVVKSVGRVRVAEVRGTIKEFPSNTE